MESFPEYVAAGVNLCLGTDTAPQSMIESLRWTAVAGKVAARRTDVSTARQVFDAATVNAARLLGRDDLGRIAPGAKADLLFWRADGFTMTPMRDPIRNLVYYAQASDLSDVLVDGRQIVEDGVVLGADVEAATRRVQQAGERMWSRWPAGRLGRPLPRRGRPADYARRGRRSTRLTRAIPVCPSIAACSRCAPPRSPTGATWSA